MMRKAGIAVVFVIVIAATGAAMTVLLDERPLTGAQAHHLAEEREEAAMLQAPPDNGLRFADPPFSSSNTDGRAGSGGRAVGYRSGGRVDASRIVAAAAPEARLWRTGFGSWEPTLGINRAGTIFFSARNSNNDPGVGISDDGGRTWRRSVPPEHKASLDPYVWVDPETGSVFASDIDPAVPCTPISRSDDDGKTWRYSRACGVADHQNHFGGSPPPGGAQPTSYPNVLYYCAISGGALAGSSTFTGCLKSLDGGLKWQPTGDPAYPPKTDPTQNVCDGGAGHGIVDGRGTVFVPRGWCGPPTIAISRDEGATWTRRQVSDKLMGNTVEAGAVHESSIAADASGNLYYVWVSAEHRPYLAISRDSGNTWEEERDLMPPGVSYVSAFAPHVDAGDEGRIAFLFMGTGDAKPGAESLWSAYMGSTTEALAADPLFYAAPANDPRTNTLWRGACDDLRCGNIGDFMDVKIGADGSVWTALVDSCPLAKDACITDLPVTTPRGEGVVGQLAGGPPLRGTIAAQRPGIGLPAARDRACRSRRNFSIRLREPRRGRLTEARVYVNGRRVRVVRGRRLRARVNLTGLPKGTFTVRVVAMTTSGRRFTSTRRYRTCVKRP
jgi:hypothetical protein